MTYITMKPFDSCTFEEKAERVAKICKELGFEEEE
mgnify:CR=1 FL=1